MARDFPHISDTTFPGVNSVNPYSFKNEFDYTRWNPGTTLKVCNVNWCGDYDNVVKFDDDAARNAYFDKITGPTHVLESAMRVYPETSVKLPIPFDELVKYNYLVVDFSTATSADNPLPYASAGNSKFFYFIRNVSYAAPSTSDCQLTLDVWTTFINKIEINYMMLERGHAPLAAMPVDEYLANPIEGNRYLLADDVSFGEPAIIKKNDFVPFGSGRKYALIATAAVLDGDLGAVNAVSPSEPGFYSTGARNGHEAGVTGAVIAAGGVDYSGLNLPTSATPNVYAIDASAFAEFIAALEVEAPHVIPAIQAVYIVDGSMVTLSDEFTIAHRNSMTWQQLANTGLTWNQLANSGYTYAQIDANANEYFGNGGGFTMFHVKPNDGLIKQLKLTKEDFSYPEEYQGIAKLYTYPYAAIEVTDPDGNSSVIKVEDTGVLALNQKASFVYPYINYSAFLTGVGGNQAAEYTWRRIDGTEDVKTLPAGDFMEYMYTYDIPTYQLYQNAYDRYRMRNYNANNVVPLTQKIQGYTNAARSANTSYENAIDSANKALANMEAGVQKDLTNTNRSAYASYQNALASNATGQVNTNASTATAYSNSVQNADSGLANTRDSNATSYDNSVKSAGTSLDNTKATNDTTTTNTRATVNASVQTTDANLDTRQNIIGKNQTAITTQTGIVTDYEKSMSALQLAKMQIDMNRDNNFLLGWAGATSDNAYANSVMNSASGVSVDQAAISDAGLSISTGLGGAAYGIEGSMGMAMGGIAAGAAAIAMPALSVAAATLPTILSANIEKAQAQGAVEQTVLKFDNNATYDLGINAAGDTNYSISVGGSTYTPKSKTAQLLAYRNATNKLKFDTENEIFNTEADNQRNVLNISNSTTTNNVRRSVETSDNNATRSYTTTLNTSAATRDTSNANAQRSYNTALSTSAATRDTSNANAQRSRSTADANANRTYSAAIDNVNNAAATTRGNAYRDARIAKANAEYSRDTALENAQDSLSNDFEVIRQGYLDKRLESPLLVSGASGDATPDLYEWRGMQIKIKTQKEGEIAPAGDLMLRYGYRLDQLWAFKGFNVMPHFSYWKCGDLWLTGGSGVIESAQETIKRILTNGVTVWRNPDEIGTISIYDNMEV